MAFRPLYNIAQPGRGFDIGMLENAEEIGDEQNNGNGLRRQPCNQGKTNRTQDRPAHHIKRTEIKSPVGIKSLSAVMHLVKNAPQCAVTVHDPVPDIESEFVQQYSNNAPGNWIQA